MTEYVHMLGRHGMTYCGRSCETDWLNHDKDQVTCERCLAALRSRASASGAGPEASAPSAPDSTTSGTHAPSAPVVVTDIVALLRKRKEFETELARLINRLSLENTFGNRADWELAALTWELLKK